MSRLKKNLDVQVIIKERDVSRDVISFNGRNVFGEIDDLKLTLRNVNGEYSVGPKALKETDPIDVYVKKRKIYGGLLDEFDDNVSKNLINQGVFSRGRGQELTWKKINRVFADEYADTIAKLVAEDAGLRYIAGLIASGKTNVSYSHAGGWQALQSALSGGGGGGETGEVIGTVDPEGNVVPVKVGGAKPTIYTPVLRAEKNIRNIRTRRKTIGWLCNKYTLIGGYVWFPFDGDEWTEKSASDWLGNAVTDDIEHTKVGGYSIKSPKVGIVDAKKFRYEFAEAIDCEDDWGSINFWIFKTNDIEKTHRVRLWAPDNANRFYRDFLYKDEEWEENTIVTGSEAFWSEDGNPDWTNVTAIEFQVKANTSGDNYVWVDGLKFLSKSRIEVTAENVLSQKMYSPDPDNPIPHEEVGNDPDLRDLVRANLLASRYVSDREHGQPRLIISCDYLGDIPIRAGEWVFLDIPQRKINGYYQVHSVSHSFNRKDGYICKLEINGQKKTPTRFFGDVEARLREVERIGASAYTSGGGVAVGGVSGGDMYKSVYDTDGDGIVDDSESLEGSTKLQVQDHTPKTHAPSHESAGGDQVNHDNLLGFVAAEHVSLPNIIANVLSDHNKAVHDALGIDAATLEGSTKVQVQDHAPKAHTHVEVDITDLDHDALKIKGKVVDDTGIADGRVLVYRTASGDLKYEDQGGAGGAAIWTLQEKKIFSAEASKTFSSLPTKDLWLLIWVGYAAGNDYYQMRMNGDSGNKYNQRHLTGNNIAQLTGQNRFKILECRQSYDVMYILIGGKRRTSAKDAVPVTLLGSSGIRQQALQLTNGWYEAGADVISSIELYSGQNLTGAAALYYLDW